jgi:hypothetical protein
MIDRDSLDDGVRTILDDARSELRAAARKIPPTSSSKRSDAPPRGGPSSGAARENGAQDPAADPSLLAILELAFTVTGRVVFNDLLTLQPAFAQEQGKSLARAWAPVLAQVSTSPLAVAIATTATVCLPYAAQLAIRRAQVSTSNAPQEPEPQGRKVGEQ